MIISKKPPFRKLRGYAFDPSLSLKIDTAGMNNITYKVKWEEDLAAGPVGEYIEVVDFDPTVKKYFTPVDLNDKNLLGQDGLAPSESNPQFHQQMVYAVTMTTIKNFEAALGRPILWSPHRMVVEKTDPKKDKNAKATAKDAKPKMKIKDEYVQRLRVYPHAFRDANAYYSPQKKALLFGYFSSQPAEITLQMPGSVVFTCLSHDIIAHETTHAILDGMFRKYIEDTNPDVLAFHEAFADTVALFQHFTFPDVLKNQIARTRGDLASQNLLGQLAQQFGTAIGNYGALRDAIGGVDPVTKTWKLKEPDGQEYRTVMEPHARGAILVSSIFDAFLTIYKSRVADLLRLSTGGTGVLPQGELHPDLVNRLAIEASKTAGHVLRMCIRALDFCPPADITFGDYLRAIITADADLVIDDDKDYRIAFIDAFRKRGIYPSGISNLSVESLCYPPPPAGRALDQLFSELTKFLREFREDIIYLKNRQEIFDTTKNYIAGQYDPASKIIYGLHRRIYKKFDNIQAFEELTGLVFNNNWKSLGIGTSTAYGGTGPSLEVQSLKFAARTGPDGNQNNQIIIALVQRAGIIVSGQEDGCTVKPFDPEKPPPEGGVVLSGGCTLIFDLDTMMLKYAISKPLLDVDVLKIKHQYSICTGRALQLKNYYTGAPGEQALYQTYFSKGRQYSSNEPFAFLHTH